MTITLLRQFFSLNLIDRYVIRQIGISFAVVLGVLTAIVWLTSSLRQLELVVSQGQTFFLFMKVTLLALPLLIGLIGPFCLFISALFVLNKLNTDSELIVMSAAGLSQPKLARPLILVALVVTGFGYMLSLLVTPGALKIVRETIIGARADFISQAIQPGRFTTVDQGLTFHIRGRGANGVLLGVFVNDERDATTSVTYLGARGIISRSAAGNFLILQQGEVVRHPKNGTSPGSVIAFESYAFSLSSIDSGSPNVVFPAQERSTAELFSLVSQQLDDQRFAGRVRSEINDRFATPLYSLSFVLIAFAAMGRAKTTRQSRGESVAVAVVVVGVLRILGFLASGLVQRTPLAIPLIYLVPISGIVLAAQFGMANKLFNFKILRTFVQAIIMPPFLRARS
ncbi:MAG: hypothetical protein A4S15_11480 [Candidatus Raskinella chloraquaticus]|uniref:Lipopolysaccharide export system permease protein LptF n=2 Tax=Candidatus Raskinella chloraquaticus TaxID=1951219 RepID=A0A1W9HVH9_9HYPH|nr:MAG: hypothetical protein A4S15_11480 [Proteobacteria bacterium SG_bin8]